MAAAFRQITNAGFTSGVASKAVAFSSNIAAGSIIIVMSAADNVLSTITFDNGHSDVYTDSGLGLVNGGAGCKYRIGAFLTPTAAATTITATYGGTNPTFGELYVYEVTGLTNAVVDKFPAATGSGTAADSGSTGTLGASDEACVAYGTTSGGFSGPGSGWSTGQGSVVGTNGGDGVSGATANIGEHRIVAATTAINGTATNSNASWSMACVTFMSGTAASADMPGGNTQLTNLPAGRPPPRARPQKGIYNWEFTGLPGLNAPFSAPKPVGTQSSQLPSLGNRQRQNPYRGWEQMLLPEGNSPFAVVTGDMPPGNQNTYLPAGRPAPRTRPQKGLYNFELSLLPGLQPDDIGVPFHPPLWELAKRVSARDYTWINNLLNGTLADQAIVVVTDDRVIGGQLTARPSLPPVRIGYTWTSNLLESTLADQAVVVVTDDRVIGSQLTVRPAGTPVRLDYTWTSNLLSRTLVELDRAVPGAQFTSRPLLPAVRLDYTWAISLLDRTLAPEGDAPPAGKQFTALPVLPPIRQTYWAQPQNLQPLNAPIVVITDDRLPQLNLYVWTVPPGAARPYQNDLRSFISSNAPLKGDATPDVTTTYQFQPILWPLPKVAYVQVKWDQPQNLVPTLLNEPGETPPTPPPTPDQPFGSGLGGNFREDLVWWRQRHRHEKLLQKLREELLAREEEEDRKARHKAVKRAIKIIDRASEETVAPDLLAELLMAAQAAFTTAQVIKAAQDTYRIVKQALDDEADDEEALTWLL